MSQDNGFTIRFIDILVRIYGIRGVGVGAIKNE